MLSGLTWGETTWGTPRPMVLARMLADYINTPEFTEKVDYLWNLVRDEAIRAQDDPRESRPASRELRLDYRRGGDLHIAYFPDAVAIRAKVQMMLADHPHLRGVFAWMMGQEDPRVWPEMRRLLH